MLGYVYILRDAKGRYYIGSTTDAPRRLRQHVQKHTWTTQRMVNPQFVLSQQYESLEAARKVGGGRIKRLKRKDYIDKMVQDGHIKIIP